MLLSIKAAHPAGATLEVDADALRLTGAAEPGHRLTALLQAAAP